MDTAPARPSLRWRRSAAVSLVLACLLLSSVGTLAGGLEGISWLPIDYLGGSDALKDAATDGARVVAITEKGLALTSSDGTRWTALAVTPVGRVLSIAYAGGWFYAVTREETQGETRPGLFRSSDGLHWIEEMPFADGAALFGVGDRLVSNAFRRLWWSQGGTQWSPSIVPATYPKLLCATNGRTWLVADPAGIWETQDFSLWKPVYWPVDRLPDALVFGGSSFVALTEGMLLRSKTGTTWKKARELASIPNTALTYGGGSFILPGPESSWVSRDGVSWSEEVSAIAGYQPIVKGVYAGGRFIFLGRDRVFLTQDGRSWTTHVLAHAPPTSNIQAVKRLGSTPLFVGVGGGGFAPVIATSSDGEEWETQSPGEGRTLLSVAYGNGVYVAVGEGGYAVRSTDARVWEAVDTGVADDLRSVEFGAGLFVAVGNRGWIRTSSDGLAWTFAPSYTSAALTSVVFADGQFVVASAEPFAWTSADGRTWTRRYLGKDYTFDYRGPKIAWVRGWYYLSGFLRSRDGIAWEEVWTPAGSYAGGMLDWDGMVLIWGSGPEIWASEDLTSWMRQPVQPDQLEALAFGERIIVAAGGGGLWKGYPRPLVRSVTPDWTPSGIDRPVQIAGGGFSDVQAVRFGSWECPSFSVVTGSLIAAVLPAGAHGVLRPVVVTSDGESLSGADVRLWTQAGPRPSQVAPSFVPPGALLQDVAVVGADLLGVSSVKTGGISMEPEGSRDDTWFSVHLPALSEGVYDVIVEDGLGRSTVLPQALTCISPPAVSSVKVLMGPLRLRIDGSHLSQDSAVFFNGVSLSKTKFKNASRLTAGSEEAMRRLLQGGVNCVVVQDLRTGLRSEEFCFNP